MKNDKTFLRGLEIELKEQIVSLESLIDFSRRKINELLKEREIKEAKNELEKFELYLDELLKKEINLNHTQNKLKEL